MGLSVSFENKFWDGLQEITRSDISAIPEGGVTCVIYFDTSADVPQPHLTFLSVSSGLVRVSNASKSGETQ